MYSPPLFYYDERLTEFNSLSVLYGNGLYSAGNIRLYLVHYLHTLNDAYCVALVYLIADLYKGRLCGGGGRVECADNGAFYALACIGRCRSRSLCLRC